MEASDLIGDVLRKIFSDPAEAQAYSEGPGDYLVAEGLGDIELNGLDMGACVVEVANELSLDNSVTETLVAVSEPVPAGPVLSPLAPPGVSSSPPPSSAPPSGGGAPATSVATAAAAASSPAIPTEITSIEQIQQVVNNYTTVVYEGDETITNNLFDNSQTLELDFEDVEGDIDLEIDMEAVNANGAGAVAAGDDIENSNIASGEGAVAFDGPNNGVVNTGVNEGIIADGDVDDAIVGDGNTQVDGDDATVVSGDGNTVNQVSGDDNVVQSGDGNENTQIDGDDATVIDSGGGDVTNTDIDAEGGANVDAVVGDGNATIQGEGNNAGFGSGDVADFGDQNTFDDAQIGFGGSANQDNDTTITDASTTLQDVGNTDTEIVTAIDNSTNDSFNADIDTEIDTTIEDSFDNEATDSFNSADDFSNDLVNIAEAGDGGVDLDDVIDD